MKRFNRHFIILLLFPVLAMAQPELHSGIDRLAAEHLKKTNGIGFVVGINNRGAENVFYYGNTEPGKQLKPDSNSIYEIGEVSGIFTTLLFSDMAILGEIKMDDPLQKYLPVDVPSPVYQKIVCQPAENAEDFKNSEYSKQDKFTSYVCLPDPNSKPQPILLCYLATHTSGFPNLPDNLKSPKGTNNPYSLYSAKDLYDFLRTYRFDDPIGYDYRFSDLGLAILGHALSLKAGKDFENLVREKILEPIGMKHTGIKVTPGQQNYFLSGYTSKGKQTNHWTYDILAPAGAFHSTIGDMMKFLAANTGSVSTPIRNVLDYSHNPRVKLSGDKINRPEAALGWMVSPLKENVKKAVWASGTTGGFASYIGFVESNRTGVVILSNCSVSLDEFGKAVLELMNKN